jgi:protein YibB
VTALPSTVAAHAPTIVTGFFDLGRESWAGSVAGDHVAPWMANLTVPDFFARSNQLYLDRFANLAPLKNPMVIFTEDRFCPFVREARAAHGLEGQTRIVACKNPFGTSTPLNHVIELTRKAMARPEFGSFVALPHHPERWNPHYVVMTVFKFSIVSTAIEMGLVDTPDLAWIDFGYCRDNDRFDKTQPWTFACGDRINIFHIQEPDDRPIFDVVRSAAVYFMACHIVSPKVLWGQYLSLIDEAFRALLDCGLPDDEQTAMLMAYRRMPSLFRTHAVDPSDWFVIFKRAWA